MNNDKTKVIKVEDLPITLTVKDVSKIMGISLGKTYELVKRRNFPCISISRRLIIPTKKFLDWLDFESNKE